MSDVRAISVDITADTSGLQRGMSDARESIESVEGEANSANRGVQRSSRGMSRNMQRVATAAKAAAAAAVAAGAAYAAHLVRQGMQAGDEQGKLARQLGITNTELATLQRAAELAGMSAGELTRNMESFNRRLGQAADGSGATADALERIGLSVSDIDDLSPDEQMRALGEALEGVESQSQRAAIANDLFGRSGQRMLLLLDDAEQTFDRASGEVDRFGLALSEVDTGIIEDANDNISTLGAVTQGAALQLAATFAPAIRDVTQRMIDFAGALSDVTREQRESTEAIRAHEDLLHRLDMGQQIDDEQRLVDGLRTQREELDNLQMSLLRYRRQMREASASEQRDLRQAIQLREQQIEAGEGNLEVLEQELIELRERNNERGRGADLQDGEIDNTEELLDLNDKRLDAIAKAEEMANMGLISEQEQVRAVISAHRDYLESVIDMGEQNRNSTQIVLNELAEQEEAYAQFNDRREEELSQQLDAFRASMRSETEALQHELAERLDLLRESRELELLEEHEYDELREQAFGEHMERMADIELETLRERREAREQEHQDEMRRLQQEAQQRQRTYFSMANNAASAFGDIAQASADSEEQQFRARKAAGTASAVVNTAEGVTNALRQGPTPLALANAATIAAAGAAQIAAINSQQMGGGARTPPTPPSGNSGNGGGSSESQDRRLIVSGIEPDQLFTGEAVRGLMDQIAEASADGYTPVIG